MTQALRILAATADPAVGQRYGDTLIRLGHDVCPAAGGRQLIELCRLLRPDVLLTETRLPDMDGVEAARLACAEAALPVLLVAPAALDADGLPPDLPVMTCLIEPVGEGALQAALVLAVAHFGRFEALRRETAELRQALEDRKQTDRAKGVLMHRLGVDEGEAFRLLHRRANNQNARLIEVARAVLAAEEVFRALEQVDGLDGCRPLAEKRPGRSRNGHRNGRVVRELMKGEYSCPSAESL